MTFKLLLKSGVRQIEGESQSEDIVEAIQDFHLKNVMYTHNTPHDDGSIAFYAVISVDGYGDYISRVFRKGIGRHGGIKPNRPSLQEIADALGVDPWELDDDWVGERDEWESVWDLK